MAVDLYRLSQSLSHTCLPPKSSRAQVSVCTTQTESKALDKSNEVAFPPHQHYQESNTTFTRPMTGPQRSNVTKAQRLLLDKSSFPWSVVGFFFMLLISHVSGLTSPE
ncbi:hypothetical protein BaRGS_00007431 [Batillaria attramentaria]|uniref:Uncharacterized protein n=1 Tax=Batillaria attramentaria TaxID=370345 RepID=A0ABD0LPY0_9CAEN